MLHYTENAKNGGSPLVLREKETPFFKQHQAIHQPMENYIFEINGCLSQGDISCRSWTFMTPPGSLAMSSAGAASRAASSRTID
jgi:hypothetical protein